MSLKPQTRDTEGDGAWEQSEGAGALGVEVTEETIVAGGARLMDLCEEDLASRFLADAIAREVFLAMLGASTLAPRGRR